MNINDWKTIQLQNDIKRIKQNFEYTTIANWSILFEVFLVLLSFVLDNIFTDPNDMQTIRWVWAILGGVGLVSTVVFSLLAYFRSVKSSKQQKKVANAKELAAIFDDELCYLIMSAENFYENLGRRKESIRNSQDALLAEFYLIETSYYLGKSVDILLKMDSNLSAVIDESDFRKCRISKRRVNNAIRLVASIYESLFAYTDLFQTGSLNKLQPYRIPVENKSMLEKYNSLKSFAEDNSTLLGINTKDIFLYGTDDFD